MSIRFRIEGLSELKAALQDLPKATEKNVMRRVLKARAQPIADDAKALCPVYVGPAKKLKIGNRRVEIAPGELKRSIKVGSKLSRHQRKDAKETKSYVEIYVGPAPLPYAHMVEFGSKHNKPHPFMRLAWDKNKTAILNGIKDDLATEIRKAAERIARKTARFRSKG